MKTLLATITLASIIGSASAVSFDVSKTPKYIIDAKELRSAIVSVYIRDKVCKAHPINLTFSIKKKTMYVAKWFCKGELQRGVFLSKGDSK